MQVTAEDTTTHKTYRLSINRGVTADYGFKATDDLNRLISAGNHDSYGIWSNETTIWVSDNVDDKLYAYNLSDGSRDTTKDFNNLGNNNHPQGIWSNGTHMWVADIADDRLYAYNMSTKRRDNSQNFIADPLEDEYGDPAGIWSDGTTMWVSDFSDDKLYAYRMSDKNRDRDRDFNTLRAVNNRISQGIWSDGTTMWVSDGGENKVFSYNHPMYITESAVDGASLTISFNRDLMAAASLANGAFTVKKTSDGGSEATVALSGTPSISGKTVSLTLAAAVISSDTDIKVSYTIPTTGSDNKLVEGAAPTWWLSPTSP